MILIVSGSLLALGLWLAGGLLMLQTRHGSELKNLWREPMVETPVLILESDDWGVGPKDDAKALTELAAILGRFEDVEGRRPVMTLGVVLGEADGISILAEDLSKYFRRDLRDPRYGQIVAAMIAGLLEGVFALQRHGLEHYWPEALLAWARQEDAARAWLSSADPRSEQLPSALQSRWVDASSLPSRSLDPQRVRDAVLAEGRLFVEIFGRAPAVAVPNTFVWSEAVEEAWAATGVQTIVTPGRRYEGRSSDGGLAPVGNAIRNGDPGCNGLHYVVRDIYFEPIRGHHAEDLWAALALHVRLGRPALVETHRESYVGRSGKAARQELARALEGALVRFPDLHFMSTEELAPKLVALRARQTCSGVRRWVVYLRRICAEPSVGRILKWSGLGLLFHGVACVGSGVTGFGRSFDRR